jgi:hypothetical protein
MPKYYEKNKFNNDAAAILANGGGSFFLSYHRGVEPYFLIF